MSLSFYFGFTVWFWICLRRNLQEVSCIQWRRICIEYYWIQNDQNVSQSKALLVHRNGWLHGNPVWCPLYAKPCDSYCHCGAAWRSFSCDIKMTCLSLCFASLTFFFFIIIVLLRKLFVFNSAFLSLGLDLSKMEAAGRTQNLYNTCFFFKVCISLSFSLDKTITIWTTQSPG